MRRDLKHAGTQIWLSSQIRVGIRNEFQLAPTAVQRNPDMKLRSTMNGIERWIQRYEGGRVKQNGRPMQAGRTSGRERPSDHAQDRHRQDGVT
jgi:hypothetical protein